MFFAAPLEVAAETFLEAFHRGDAAESAGNHEEAIAAYSIAKSIAGTPVNDARIQLARLFHKLARFDEAESEYQAMVSISNRLELKRELANLYKDEGKFKNASILYQELLAQDRQDYNSMLNLAVCLEATESMESAQDYYRQVVEQAPGTPAAAYAQAKLNRVEKAITAQRSSQFFPIDPEFGPVGLGWWNLKKMPIHVYIDQGDSVNYRPSMRNHVIAALEAWRQASGSKISFVIDPSDAPNELAFKAAIGNESVLNLVGGAMPEDPIKTGIHVHWTDNLKGAAGVAWTNVYADHNSEKSERVHEITFGHVWLHTNTLADGSPLPDRETSANSALFQAQDRLLAEVAIHELGHCLGLTHSSNSRDIMCSGVFALNSHYITETRNLSPGDVASLAQHYNNFQGTGMPSRVTKISSDGTVTVYHDSDGKPATARVQNPAPVRLTSTAVSPAIPPTKIPSRQSQFDDILFDINSRNYRGSLEKLERMLSKEPQNAMALYLRGVTYVMLHRYSEASADYELVMKIAPDSEIASRAIEGLKKLRYQR